MRCRPLIIVATIAPALLAPVAFAAESGDQQDEWPMLGLDFVAPRTHTICLEGFGTLDCRSTRLTPDPEDCVAGESLITVRRFGSVSHVCVPSK
jgi:hypothetical protein